MNNNEIATVLASLRYFQESVLQNNNLPTEHFSQFDDAIPLTPGEIDSVCEKINLYTPTVLLVDQRDISVSFDSISLFVNDVHIVDTDAHNIIPIVDIAENLSKVMCVDITRVTISTEELARSIAEQRDLAEQFDRDLATGDIDFEDYTQGYTNDDLLKAIRL